MPRLEGGPHGLKADPSARADDQDYRHGVMLPVGPAWLTVMCDAGSRTARWAGGLKRVSRAVRSHAARLAEPPDQGLPRLVNRLLPVPSQNLTHVTPQPREFHLLTLHLPTAGKGMLAECGGA